MLQHSGLGRYAATSYGAHQRYGRHLAAQGCAFAQQQRAVQGAAMSPRRVTMALDEVVFAGLPTLVALEPAPNLSAGGTGRGPGR